MIARLKGIIDDLGPDWLVIDVSGVGYLVHCPARTINALPGLGTPTDLHIETHVRESQISLYGFSDVRQRECFRLLTTVQGVGAKVALAILGTLSPDQLVEAILAQDKALMSRADGVGPRLAARLLTELKDRILTVAGGLHVVAADRQSPATAPTAATAGPEGVTADAISALVNLGYGRAEAFGAVTRAIGAPGEASSLEALIPAALKELGQ
ncbi:MAG: Holliday junction branch migration protein RuvA [Alphaproteobacteria bacterium]|nr:Holliday junction branch migration protein RuvA [Alphaproteobacteria bacterium]MCZ6840753.1 Holliday junction branch migration protein RuvA [Alphaproteobacteria bacterium]